MSPVVDTCVTPASQVLLVNDDTPVELLLAMARLNYCRCRMSKGKYCQFAQIVSDVSLDVSLPLSLCVCVCVLYGGFEASGCFWHAQNAKSVLIFPSSVRVFYFEFNVPCTVLECTRGRFCEHRSLSLHQIRKSAHTSCGPQFCQFVSSNSRHFALIPPSPPRHRHLPGRLKNKSPIFTFFEPK